MVAGIGAAIVDAKLEVVIAPIVAGAIYVLGGKSDGVVACGEWTRELKADSDVDWTIDLKWTIFDLRICTGQIYALSIAIARIRLNQRISSDTDSRFIQRICRLLEFSWIDSQSRQILQKWLEMLG